MESQKIEKAESLNPALNSENLEAESAKAPIAESTPAPKAEKAKKPGKGKKAAAPKKESKQPEKPKAKKTFYGHRPGTQAGTIDDLLIGKRLFTISEMAKEMGVEDGRIKSHIRHLESEKNVVFVKREDGKLEIKGKEKKAPKAAKKAESEKPAESAEAIAA